MIKILKFIWNSLITLTMFSMFKTGSQFRRSMVDGLEGIGGLVVNIINKVLSLVK